MKKRFSFTDGTPNVDRKPQLVWTNITEEQYEEMSLEEKKDVVRNRVKEKVSAARDTAKEDDDAVAYLLAVKAESIFDYVIDNEEDVFDEEFSSKNNIDTEIDKTLTTLGESVQKELDDIVNVYSKLQDNPVPLENSVSVHTEIDPNTGDVILMAKRKDQSGNVYYHHVETGNPCTVRAVNTLVEKERADFMANDIDDDLSQRIRSEMSNGVVNFNEESGDYSPEDYVVYGVGGGFFTPVVLPESMLKKYVEEQQKS